MSLPPVLWHPASDEDFKDAAEGGRSGYQPIAIVHHRIVGSLGSADSTFAHADADPATVGASGRPVSAQFAIGHRSGVLTIIQFVDLSDTAYCNGDCSQDAYGIASKFDGLYGHKGHNERTISIEHEDNAGSSDPLVKGVVPEDVIKASIALDRLMLTGDIVAMRAAGIHIRDAATATALGKIVPSATTLLDHNDIAGKGKPYCWRPWAGDVIGFPRARYVKELTPVPVVTYTQAQMDDAIKAATDPLKASLDAASTALTAALAANDAQFNIGVDAAVLAAQGARKP